MISEKIMEATCQCDAARLLRVMFPAAPTPDMPCAKVYCLLTRTANLLTQHGAVTLADAAARTADEMLSWEGFGHSLLSDIEGALSRVGLRLRTREDDDATPISALGLSTRSNRCVTALGIMTIGELLSTPLSSLMEVKNFGKGSIAEINSKLASAGFGPIRERQPGDPRSTRKWRPCSQACRQPASTDWSI